jgi:hypothetical protein
MHKRTALPFLASLCLMLSAAPAPAQTPAEGQCYSVRPLPALPSGTRVFVQPSLVLNTKPSEADIASGAVMTTVDGKGRKMTVRADVSICAYPPNVPLPSYLAGATPDLIMP